MRTWQASPSKDFLKCLSTIWCKTCWLGKMCRSPDNVFHSKHVTAPIPHYQYTDFTLLAVSRTIKRSYQEWLNQISGHSNSSWTIVTSSTSPEARAIYVRRTCIQFEWSVRLVSIVMCSVASDCTPFKRRQTLFGTYYSPNGLLLLDIDECDRWIALHAIVVPRAPPRPKVRSPPSDTGAHWCLISSLSSPGARPAHFAFNKIESPQ